MTQTSHNWGQKQDNGGFAGTLRNIQLTDIIQMCCLAGASLCIRVTQAGRQGTIFIEEGRVVHAEYGQAIGTEAFFTILGWPSGRFDTMEAPAVLKPTIKEPCQFLLMEAARQIDEGTPAAIEETVVEEELELSEPEKLRVLIVDDSPIMSKILTTMLSADAAIEVVGVAKNGEEALVKMRSLAPDLITMDVNMPVMDGSTALKHIMIESPCPVIIMSNLLPTSYDTLLSFLNLGAVDFMSKPVKSGNILVQQQRIVERVHRAARADVKRFKRLRCPKLKPSDFIQVKPNDMCQQLVITLAGSGGHLEAVNTITALPRASRVAVLSIQSVPPAFTPMLAAYLDARSRFEVRALEEKELLSTGRCYIANASTPISFAVCDGQWVVQKELRAGLSADQAIDRLFSTAADLFHEELLVILLSGADLGTMEGLRTVKDHGGKIMAPKPDRCILPSPFLPALEAGLVMETFDPADVTAVLARYCK